MSPFTQYKQWMIERYGEPLFRIPVEIASSCPHGRCAFCSENGSRAQQTQQQESPFEQVKAAIKFSKRRYKAKKFMLYIQAFTADLTDPAQQATIIDLLDRFDFDAISIGTRPDCLADAALNFLQNLTTPHEVWLELGVQTANDKTLKMINRGHDWECSKQAILALAERGIHVAPHVILGLPNENPDDWSRTAEELAKLPISGIKIHNLHIMKGTALADNPPPTLNHWEYAEGLMDFLRRIPADIPVMRISTDTPDDQLIAPHWNLEKGQFLDYVIQQMTCRQVRQGDLTETGNLKFETGMEPVITDDGSITYFSKDWKEHYHTKAGARLEADKKFVEPSGLASKLQTSNLKLLDVCFGLGNNSLAALCAQSRTGILPVCPRTAAEPPQTGKMPVLHSLDITALEMDKRIVRAAAENFRTLETDPVDWQETLSELLHSGQSSIDTQSEAGACDSNETKCSGNHQLAIQWGDARYLIQQISDNSMDVVFHDPFSSQHCPELWTVEFFKQLHRVMKPDGVLLTYSSAAPVRGAMREAGFFIAETEPGHQMGNGTIASKQESVILSLVGQGCHFLRALPRNNEASLPLVESLYSESLCSSGGSGDTRSRIREACPTINKRKSIPYRDEHLCATSKAILRQRQEAVENNIQ